MAARALCVAQGGGLHAGRPKQPGAPQPARQPAPLLPLPKRLPKIALPALLGGLGGFASPPQQPGGGTKAGGDRQQTAAAAAASQPACPTQCPDTAKTEARKLADQKYDFLLATFAVLLLLACCPLGLLVSVALVVADLLSQLVLNLLSGVPIDASSSFLLGLVVGAAGSIKRLVSRWRGRRNDGNNGGTAPAGA